MMHSDLTINIQNTPTPIPCGLFYNLTKESLYIPKKGGTDMNICILEDNKATAESVFKMALNSCPFHFLFHLPGKIPYLVPGKYRQQY